MAGGRSEDLGSAPASSKQDTEAPAEPKAKQASDSERLSYKGFGFRV